MESKGAHGLSLRANARSRSVPVNLVCYSLKQLESAQDYAGPCPARGNEEMWDD
jgi:hypothetical protein